ncbi:uncharacterized protein LOC125650640 [Ostrea edulis]|uniref:uncharacterized protein LOC125650640 n=1 Tax=Ostrea edulis TaxID=37623 RepID=UPI002096525A|nr:uncharacterized protein LOC125650640 [Ostrea edulis]
MKGLRVVSRGFSTSAIRRDVQDMKPRFLVPKSSPSNPFSYENLVVKRMKYYLKPATEFTHNRTPFGKPYTIFVTAFSMAYFVYYTIERALYLPNAQKS